MKQIQPNIKTPLKSSIRSISVNKLIGIFAAVGEDKGYRFGPELVDQVNWCAVGLAWWDGFTSPNWSGNGVSVVSDGNTGNLVRNNFGVVGKRYQVRIDVVVTAGLLFWWYNGVGYDYTINVTGSYSFSVVSGYANLDNRSVNFDGSITALSIKEIFESEE